MSISPLLDTEFDSARAAASVPRLEAVPPLVQKTPRQRATSVLLWVNATNLVIILGFFLVQGGLNAWTQPGELMTIAGRIAGLIGTYCCLVELVLMARLPWLDRTIGMDRLARWHRLNGHAALYLMVAHAIFITLGYAAAQSQSIAAQALDLVLNYRDVLMATVALALFIGTVVVSIKIARRRLRYETWHFVHLYTYLAIALALPHQLVLGNDFVGHPLTQAYWWMLFIVAVGSIVVFRFGTPLAFNLRHQLRVTRVVREGPGIVSLYISGRKLDKVGAVSGQFFLWRFLHHDMWWQAHPYSLSAAPNGRELRITVKDLGDHSAALASIKVNTRIFAEGPYGAFTTVNRTRRSVLFIGGGIGMTPVRALFESIPANGGDITFIYRVSDVESAVMLDELTALAKTRSARLHLVTGRRKEFPAEAQPFSTAHLAGLVPDVRKRDVFICGPEPMMQQAVRSLLRLGVNRNSIHFESFEY